MQYISTKEASEKWGISERRVRALCSAGKIEGVTRCGSWVWSIPADTQKPADGRTLRYMRNRSLRTGNQDYSQADSLRKSGVLQPLTETQKAMIVREALCYDEFNASLEQIEGVFDLTNQKDLDLTTQVLALNMKSALGMIPFDLTEKTMLDIHSRLLVSLDEKQGGKYALGANQSQETEAMLEQYSGAWSVLHPVARAAFLFAEIIRIRPFEDASPEVGFILLANEMYKAKLPPAVFGVENLPQLKAALASTEIRGNSQNLVSMILDSLQK